MFLSIRFYFLCFGLATLLLSCNSSKTIAKKDFDDFDVEVSLLDTLTVTPDVAVENKVYRPTAKLDIDILHTKLDIQFDWQNRYVIGVAEIDLKPYFRPIEKVVLDAVGFDIKLISMGLNQTKVNYDYDGKQIIILLERPYTRNEILHFRIEYIAKPDENLIGGSEAITSDKGLFFINPMGNDPDVPTQIWTQGETENNSRWFPTFDKPNERFTQEVVLTVEDKYQTLSNGMLKSSIKNGDGTRTDHWKLDKPHAPYLAMIAVGEFDIVADEWNEIPMHYYVEKGFGKHAKKIFNHTKEMMAFFTDVLKYPYPWDKYSQIIVREFVSGAMENTGAVVFGDFVQKTGRELIDDDNDYIVAHEMMHHWFGNLVTCEDWSNLTLNEGFANYAEYLWMEHKYGRNRADYHRIDELNGYYNQVFQGGARNIVDYYYSDKEDMFDAHSYNKGGLVLHMLRYYLGDDVFFTALNKYLNDHKDTAVEVDELRIAFEDVSGEDLKWFFNQWFLAKGHPHIKVGYDYDKEGRRVVLNTDMSGTPEDYYQNFILPTKVALYFADGSMTNHSIIIDQRQQTFILNDVLIEPATYVLDGENVLLALINEDKSPEMYRHQFMLSPLLFDKILGFAGMDGYDNIVIDKALNDDFYYIRSLAVNAISLDMMSEYHEKLIDLVLKDPHSQVRAMALIQLMEQEDFDPTALCKLVLLSEKAYPVLSIALSILSQTDKSNAKSYFDKFKNEESDYLASVLISFVSDEQDEYLEYFESKAKTIKLTYLFEFHDAYQQYLEGKSIKTLRRTAQLMNDIASNTDNNFYRRYASAMTLNKILSDLEDDTIYIPTTEGNALKEEVKRMIEEVEKSMAK